MTVPLNVIVFVPADNTTSLCNVNAPLKVCDCAEVMFPLADVAPLTEIAPFVEVTSATSAFPQNVISPFA